MSGSPSNLFNRITARIFGLVARGLIRAVDDTTKAQLIRASLRAGEERGKLERFGQYGFTSVPHKDAECLVLFPGGDTSHGIVIGVEDRRYRFKAMQNGEVAIYTDEGDRIHFQRGNTIRVQTDTFRVVCGQSSLVLDNEGLVVNAPSVDFNS